MIRGIRSGGAESHLQHAFCFSTLSANMSVSPRHLSEHADSELEACLQKFTSQFQERGDFHSIFFFYIISSSRLSPALTRSTTAIRLSIQWSDNEKIRWLAFQQQSGSLLQLKALFSYWIFNFNNLRPLYNHTTRFLPNTESTRDPPAELNYFSLITIADWYNHMLFLIFSLLLYISACLWVM